MIGNPVLRHLGFAATDRVVLIGRSFGGRMCTRVAAVEPPAALVLLGHPIAPRNRPRPDDEAALQLRACPTADMGLHVTLTSEWASLSLGATYHA